MRQLVTQLEGEFLRELQAANQKQKDEPVGLFRLACRLALDYGQAWQTLRRLRQKKIVTVERGAPRHKLVIRVIREVHVQRFDPATRRIVVTSISPDRGQEDDHAG